MENRQVNIKKLYEYIKNLLENKAIATSDNISHLIFQSPDTKSLFYDEIKKLDILKIVNVSRTTISNLMKKLEDNYIMIDEKPYCIKEQDFMENGQVNIKKLYEYIKNLLENKAIATSDRIRHLIFQSVKIKSLFYDEIKKLDIIKDENVSITTIANLMYKLEYDYIMIDEKPYCIKEQDFMENGQVNIKKLYECIKNLLENEAIATTDSIKHLIFQSVKIKSLFYDEIKKLDIIKDENVSRTTISHLMKKLKDKI